MSGRQLRGVASMTNTEVEAANRAIAATGSGFVFVPTLDMAAGSKSSRTPHIHFDAQGNDIGEKVPAHSASAPVPKKQKAPRPPGRPAGEPRVRTQAPPPWPGQPQSLTQQRSKRPKLQARASTGGAFRDDEKAGNSAELKACAKLLKEVTRHTFAWPFVKAVDPTAFPDYYQVVTNPIDLGMIERGLKNNQYEDADEFYAVGAPPRPPRPAGASPRPPPASPAARRPLCPRRRRPLCPRRRRRPPARRPRARRPRARPRSVFSGPPLSAGAFPVHRM